MWEIWRSHYKRWFWLGGLVFLAAFLPLRDGKAGSGAVISHKLIAVYLFNFSNYVNWPEQEAITPICLYGDAPVEEALRYIANQQKSISVKHVGDVSQIGGCQIVFIGEEKTPDEARAALQAVRSRAVLTVSELSGFTGMGGMIEFVYGEDGLKIRIHKTSLERAGLKVNSKLMSLAEVVE